MHVCILNTNVAPSSNVPHQILSNTAGLQEIAELIDNLHRTLPSNQFHILPLHSELSSAEQQRVFAPPPSGLSKIVVATNIAEVRLKSSHYDVIEYDAAYSVPTLC